MWFNKFENFYCIVLILMLHITYSHINMVNKETTFCAITGIITKTNNSKIYQSLQRYILVFLSNSHKKNTSESNDQNTHLTIILLMHYINHSYSKCRHFDTRSSSTWNSAFCPICSGTYSCVTKNIHELIWATTIFVYIWYFVRKKHAITVF